MTGIWPPEQVYPAAQQCPFCWGVFTWFPGDTKQIDGGFALPCHYCGRAVPVDPDRVPGRR